MHRFTRQIVKNSLTKRYQMRQVNVFAEFKNSIKRQVEENKELQKDVKLLAQEGQKVTESETMKNAKATTSKVINAVGSAVDATLQNPVVQGTGKILYKTVETVADVSQKVAEPIMKTEAAKTVSKGIYEIKNEVVGVTGNAYFAEYASKEAREEKKRVLESREKRKVKKVNEHGLPVGDGPLDADSESTGLVMHKSGRLAEAWEKFKTESAFGQTLHNYKRSFSESDGIVARGLRFASQAFTVKESEASKVVRSFRSIDPSFEPNLFLNHVANFTIPELLEAYLHGDEALLKEWVTEGQLARIKADSHAQKVAGLIPDCKIVDMRHVELSKMILLDDEFPVAVVTFQTTEIICFKNKKGEVKLGAEDNLVNGHYIFAFTKSQLIDPDAPVSDVTDGWLILQWARMTR